MGWSQGGETGSSPSEIGAPDPRQPGQQNGPKKRRMENKRDKGCKNTMNYVPPQAAQFYDDNCIQGYIKMCPLISVGEEKTNSAQTHTQRER